MPAKWATTTGHERSVWGASDWQLNLTHVVFKCGSPFCLAGDGAQEKTDGFLLFFGATGCKSGSNLGQWWWGSLVVNGGKTLKFELSFPCGFSLGFLRRCCVWQCSKSVPIVYAFLWNMENCGWCVWTLCRPVNRCWPCERTATITSSPRLFMYADFIWQERAGNWEKLEQGRINRVSLILSLSRTGQCTVGLWHWGEFAIINSCRRGHQ